MINSSFSWPDLCISTTGGTANGANCVFPFIYRGTNYTQCTNEEVGPNFFHDDWCAITNNYDIDKKWGYCVIKINEYQFHPVDGASIAKEGTVCKFPFEYDGKTHEECKSSGVNGSWCLTKDDNWGYCDRSCNNTGKAVNFIYIP